MRSGDDIRESSVSVLARIHVWTLRAALSVPAIWLAIHASFVHRASAVGMWPFDQTGHGGAPPSMWEFPLHFELLVATSRVHQTVPYVVLVFMATQGSRWFWWLMIPTALLQTALYAYALNTPMEQVAFWTATAGCSA